MQLSPSNDQWCKGILPSPENFSAHTAQWLDQPPHGTPTKGDITGNDR
ncbi:unnamed protein product [marine sediment metagenome]|uniref:Uncharacterized protein n=1 Tax=marine sediment metagenome TaxID=412755 RepID=X1JK92_9ZZZZ